MPRAYITIAVSIHAPRVRGDIPTTAVRNASPFQFTPLV